MRIQYCSDLHLEFPENNEWIKNNPIIPKADVLILAGDICLLETMDRHSDFFDYVSDHFATTYWLPGNHEYYYSDVSERSDTFFESIRSNIFLLNNHSVTIKDIRILFSTLWASISPANRWSIEHGVNDFKLIAYQNRRLSVSDFNQLHIKSVEFLEKEFENSSGKTIVVTHHVPTLKNYPAKYINSKINEAFVTELSPLIESSKADFWIYGHHHNNIPAFSIGRTTLITNQLGYVHNNENSYFKHDACIEL